MNLNTRNYPPKSGIRVPAEEMKTLLIRLFEAVYTIFRCRYFGEYSEYQ
mgnify:CR=1 FL=1